jgi:prepilin-type N-terminal cleavage/methylation domain-containing protein
VRRGFSLIELAVTIAVMSVVTVATLPALKDWLSWVAVEAASADITTALAVARSAAIANGFRSRVVLAADSLRIARWTGSSWQPYLRWTGPSERGVELTVSNPEVVFGPTGIAWGPSNTEAVLRSRSRYARITVSRVGRVKRWL